MKNQLGPTGDSWLPQVGSEAVEWVHPLPLDDDLPPVLPFDPRLLPESIRTLVCDVADRMQVPIDYPAIVAVLSLAGAVNRRSVIQPKRYDTSWVVIPNLWGGIIGPPGVMKSPVIAAMAQALERIEHDWRSEFDEAQRAYAMAKEEFELRHNAWKEMFKAASKHGRAAPGRPEGEPVPPKLRRLIVNDSTFEALHRTMSDNPAGILVVRDELTGWWSSLDRAGREGEREFLPPGMEWEHQPHDRPHRTRYCPRRSLLHVDVRRDSTREAALLSGGCPPRRSRK